MSEKLKVKSYMEKKKYMKPSMKVYEMGVAKIICGSAPGYPGNFNYIPGQPEDEKQLA